MGEEVLFPVPNDSLDGALHLMEGDLIPMSIPTPLDKEKLLELFQFFLNGEIRKHLGC